MSDGPHKSLPMKRKWKKVAERADNRATSIEEISDALNRALVDDCRKELSAKFLEGVRGFYEGQDALLIKDDPKTVIEALRQDATTVFDKRFLDHAQSFVAGEAGELTALVDKTMAAVLCERTANAIRQMEEHYHRESTKLRSNNLRIRLEQAAENAPFDGLAHQVLKQEIATQYRLSAKRDGLDDGPAIK